MELDESQIRAVEAATSRRFSIINGGAGCGKTTIIRHITERLEGRGEQVAICAFAGKAAARIREATGHDASTIHRLLQWEGTRFLLHDLSAYAVIIDEASMVNSRLLAEIVRRKPRRLVLVGDEAQLPPVGAGQPFHDLIRLRPQVVSSLTTCHRASEAIFRAASLIRTGQQPCREERTSQEHWAMLPTGGPRETHKAILDMVRRGELDFAQDIILSPRNEDESSAASAVSALNRDIVQLVNPHPAGERLAAGDRVICGKNNAELDVWNGTTATVMAVDPSGRMQIRTDTEVVGQDGQRTNDVDVPADFARNFSHAYALTVHKSQGSQYRRVLVICLQRDSFALLSRSLLYTAVTRARRECLVMGELRTFADAITRVSGNSTVMQQLAALERS